MFWISFSVVLFFHKSNNKKHKLEFVRESNKIFGHVLFMSLVLDHEGPNPETYSSSANLKKFAVSPESFNDVVAHITVSSKDL